MPWRRNSLAPIVAALAVLAVAATVVANQRFARADLRHRAEALTGGRVDRGRALFATKGCGGCHTVSGVPGADFSSDGSLPSRISGYIAGGSIGAVIAAFLYTRT